MRIVLVEPNLSGHHQLYLESFYGVLKDLGHDVSIISSDSTLYKGKVLKYTNPILYFKNGFLKKINVFFNLFITVLNLWRVRSLVKKNVDGIFFCCIDDYMNELLPAFLFDLLIPVQVSGLILKARFYNSFFEFDRRNILRANRFRSIGSLDEFATKELQTFNKNVIRFPDFSDETDPNVDYSLATYILEQANGRKIISILGAIHMRKGIHTFVECSKIMSTEKYYFIIVGKSYLSPKEENYLQLNFIAENTFFSLQKIPTEADFNRLVQISDVIFAAYLNFTQSSNMLAKSALFSKPLIVSKGYYMEEATCKYSLGYVIEQNSIDEAALFICSAAFDWDNKCSDASNYLANNCTEKLYDSFGSVIKSFEPIL